MASRVRWMPMSTTFCPGPPDSGIGRYSIACNARMNGVGNAPDEALRKNSAVTGWPQVSSANCRRRSHRGRSSGLGR